MAKLVAKLAAERAAAKADGGFGFGMGGLRT